MPSSFSRFKKPDNCGYQSLGQKTPALERGSAVLLQRYRDWEHLHSRKSQNPRKILLSSEPEPTIVVLWERQISQRLLVDRAWLQLSPGTRGSGHDISILLSFCRGIFFMSKSVRGWKQSKKPLTPNSVTSEVSSASFSARNVEIEKI